VVDFYCHELRLAIEIDGAVHRSEATRREDADRQAALEQDGIAFLRYFPGDVERRLDWVLNAITRTCSRRAALTPTLSQRERARWPVN
jgi:very-short-patch-repair endonuclease